MTLPAALKMLELSHLTHLHSKYYCTNLQFIVKLTAALHCQFGEVVLRNSSLF